MNKETSTIQSDLDPRSPFYYEALNRVLYPRITRTFAYKGERWTVPTGPIGEPIEQHTRPQREAEHRAWSREHVARISGPYPQTSSADFASVSAGLPGLGKR